MTKVQMAELHKLSVKDKIRVVQSLWDDIAKEQSLDSVPSEHKRILDERIKLINSGTSQFKPWTEVQKKYRKLL
jgi:putative addiction module component (TIGR02574 family)